MIQQLIDWFWSLFGVQCAACHEYVDPKKMTWRFTTISRAAVRLCPKCDNYSYGTERDSK